MMSSATTESKISVGIPAWVSAIGKSGGWAILTFWLVYSLLLQRENQMTAVIASVAQNGNVMATINSKMDLATTQMHAFVMQSQAESDRIKIVILQVCVQQAEMLKMPGGTQKCFEAAQGKKIEP